MAISNNEIPFLPSSHSILLPKIGRKMGNMTNHPPNRKKNKPFYCCQGSVIVMLTVAVILLASSNTAAVATTDNGNDGHRISSSRNICPSPPSSPFPSSDESASSITTDRSCSLSHESSGSSTIVNANKNLPHRSYRYLETLFSMNNNNNNNDRQNLNDTTTAILDKNALDGKPSSALCDSAFVTSGISKKTFKAICYSMLAAVMVAILCYHYRCHQFIYFISGKKNGSTSSNRSIHDTTVKYKERALVIDSNPNNSKSSSFSKNDDEEKLRRGEKKRQRKRRQKKRTRERTKKSEEAQTSDTHPTSRSLAATAIIEKKNSRDGDRSMSTLPPPQRKQNPNEEGERCNDSSENKLTSFWFSGCHEGEERRQKREPNRNCLLLCHPGIMGEEDDDYNKHEEDHAASTSSSFTISPSLSFDSVSDATEVETEKMMTKDEKENISELVPSRPPPAQKAVARKEKIVRSITTTTTIMYPPQSSNNKNDNDIIKTATYVNNKCIFQDKQITTSKEGKSMTITTTSPANVLSGETNSPIPPPTYIRTCNNDLQKACKMWSNTKRWRMKNEVWCVHTRPLLYFDRIKSAYPHFTHGYSKGGFPVVYEQPGKMVLKELFRAGEIDKSGDERDDGKRSTKDRKCSDAIREMIHQYVFFIEYICNVVCVSPESTSRRQRQYDEENKKKQEENGPTGLPPIQQDQTTNNDVRRGRGSVLVMDLKDASISHLSGDILKYLKLSSQVQSSHYPTSIKQAFLINAPFWLAGVWKGLHKILPKTIHFDLLSTPDEYLPVLREYMDDDQIPCEYGGSSPYALNEHPLEMELREFVKKVNENKETNIDSDAFSYLA